VTKEDKYDMLMMRFYRRLNFIEEYIDQMDRDDICEFWNEGETDSYVHNTLVELASQLCDEFGGDMIFHDVLEYLIDNGYESVIKDFFIDTHNNYCSK
jgi:hypothetical protein